MPSPPTHALQLYDDDAFLAQAGAEYLARGAKAGHRLLVIATTARQRRLLKDLSSTGVAVDALIAAGDLTLVDARALLDEVSVGGEPQVDPFRRRVASLIDGLAADGRHVCAFSEAADLVWRDGRPLAARQLEVFWKQASAERGFSLLCAHGLDTLATDVEGAHFDEISRQHGRVIPAGALARAGDDEARDAEVARLQQRAWALERELQGRSTAADHLEGLERLHGMSLRLLGTHHIGTLLEGVLDAAVELSGTDMGLLSIIDEPRTSLRVGASRGMSQEIAAAVARMETVESVCGRALSERRRVIVEDIDADPAFAEFLPVAREAGFRAVHCTPLVTRHGDVLGVLSVLFRNSRRPTPREIQLLDLCARQAVDLIENANLYSRLRANDRRKDEFLAVLAHELRNPLAPIQNAVAIARSTCERSASGDAAFDVIDRQVRHLARLVDDLTDISRITTGRLDLRTQRLDLAQLIDAALETSRPLIDAAGRELTVRTPTTRVVIEGDLTRLAQVLANLLNNAVKYSDRGGRITLEAAVDRPGGHVTISVRDTGIGMTPELTERVFNVFDHPVGPPAHSRGGLGVGLTLSRRLIELHGGTIDAYSPGPGRGSRFTIRLPLVRAWEMGSGGDAPAKADTAESTAPQRDGLKILVVDDNVDSAETMALLLEQLGNEVRTAHDGQQAIDVADEFQPQAILLDIGLPIRSGLEVAREVRRRPWADDVTIIAMSGWGQESDRKSSREAGFNSHLVKPIDYGELRRLLAARAEAGRGGS